MKNIEKFNLQLSFTKDPNISSIYAWMEGGDHIKT